MLTYKYLKTLVYGQEKSWFWNQKEPNLVSYLKTIMTAMKTQMELNSYFATNDIPILIYDYSLEAALQQELNEGGTCITIKFPNINRVEYQGPNAKAILINGVVEVYELVAINRDPNKASWQEGLDISEEVFGSLSTDLIINDIIVKLYVESIMAKHSTNPKGDNMLKYEIAYNLKGYVKSANS